MRDAFFASFFPRLYYIKTVRAPYIIYVRVFIIKESIFAPFLPENGDFLRKNGEKKAEKSQKTLFLLQNSDK